MPPEAKSSRKLLDALPPSAPSKTIEVGAGVFKDTCLTKHGSAVARLIPPDVAVPSALGFMRGTVVDQTDIVGPDFEAWADI
jgi:hypothetical protein